MKNILFVFLLSACLFVPIAGSAEDVVSLAQVDASDGIHRDEANVIAREFFHRYVSACGRLSDASETGSAFEYRAFLGKKEKPFEHPVVVDKTSGEVSMEVFSIPLSFKDISPEPPLAETLEACETSGEEDVLAWEHWLQKERKANIHFYCPPTDYYTLLLEPEDYPLEARSLAAHQKFAFCKYGNPATIFAVLTDDEPAKAEACAEEQFAAVRAGDAYEMQPLPASSDTFKRFKLVSPHFAAVIYTTVYDLENYQYWVDRSYEVMRTMERVAVNCICPADCPRG